MTLGVEIMTMGDYLRNATLYLGDGQHDDISTLKKSQRRQHLSFLLLPISKVLRGSADIVNGALLQIRDARPPTDDVTAEARLQERKQIVSLRLKNATTRQQWRAAAQELDLLYNNHIWKSDPNSPDFDAKLIEARLKQLDEARTNCDVPRMLHLIRTSLARDLGGMGNIKLYKHSLVGTKDIIERYIDSALETIRALVKISGQMRGNLGGSLEIKDVLEQVVYARQAFGRSALLLSGGATFGMNHVGVLKALFEVHLLPRIISGASAGSIVCAVLCTRTDEEIPEVLQNFPYGDLAVFEEDGNEDGILQRVGRFLTEGAWIDIKHLIRVMKELLGDMTFQEAYNRTRRILNICVSSASVYELPRLLNYVTSPNVMIWSAVAASCSVPLLFSAVQLLVKNPVTGEHSPWNPTPQRWVDGSVDNDLPMTRLAEMFNVNHFIVSQVNPHVVPFLAKDDEAIAQSAQNEETGPGLLYTITNLAKDEALHRMHVLAEMGIFPNLVTKCRSVLSQKYSGDITILPEISYADFPRMLKNPTSDFMERTCLAGERATWPRLSRIRNHCAVELELDSAVQQLRTRVVFSPSQVDLRRMTTGSNLEYTQTLPRTHPERRRRVSGSNLKTLGRHHQKPSSSLDLDTLPKDEPRERPSLRKTSSHLNHPDKFLQLLDLPKSQQAQTLPRSHTYSQTQPTTPAYRRQFPHFTITDWRADFSSGAETTVDDSTHSSDADIDSHTDDSSPGSGHEQFPDYEPSQSSFFLVSHPVTPFGEAFGGLSPILSRDVKDSAAVGPRGEREPSREMSAPERKYKTLFHPQPELVQENSAPARLE